MIKTNKDYTLNGRLTGINTWQEFRLFVRNCGINTGTKTYEQLKTEMEELIQNYDPMWYVLSSEYRFYCKVDTKEEALAIKRICRDRITIWTPIEFGVNNEHFLFIEALTLITKDEMINKFNTVKEEKEDITMRELIERAEQMLAATTITKTSDTNYVDKKMLAKMITDLGNGSPNPDKNTRPVLISWLRDTVDALYDGIAQFAKDSGITVPAGDMTNDKYYPEDNEQASTQIEKKYFDTLPTGLINKLLGEFYDRRRKRDGRGLIDVSDAYKAVCACVHGHLTDKDIKKYINTLFKMKYITYKNTDGYVQLFIAFKDVTTDESGKVIGVRW